MAEQGLLDVPASNPWISALSGRVLMILLSHIPRNAALNAAQSCRTLLEAHDELVC